MKKLIAFAAIIAALSPVFADTLEQVFTDGNLFYKITSLDPPEAAVTMHPMENYMGSYTVPAKVMNGTTEYTVTAIGKLAFDEANYVTSVTLPGTIRTIEKFAFDESGIRSIEIPEGVTLIDTWAFSSCPYLREVKLPESLDSIGYSCFDNNEGLSEFTFPKNVKRVGLWVLDDCKGLKKVTFSGSMDSIPGHALDGCSKLEEVVMPEGTKRIGEFAFANCGALVDFTIPQSVEAIDRFAFGYCTTLPQAPFNNNITKMGKGVLYMCGAINAVDNFPSALTTIPESTFQCCSGLLKFTIGDNVTEIGEQAFYYCFDLQELTIGENVQTIGAEAFYIPEIDNAHDLKTIYCKAPVPPSGLLKAKVANLVYEQAELYVPAESIEAYKTAPGWKLFKNIKPMDSSVKAIDIAPGCVEVYSLDGTLVFAGAKAEMPALKGTYVIRSANATVKVIL